MLMFTQALRYAHQLLDARAAGRQFPPISSSVSLSVEDAYEIAQAIIDIRIAQGEVPVGRKIGFANHKHFAHEQHPHKGLPSWSMLFDATVRYAKDNQGIQSLQGALQPRLQPEIIFKLGKTPEPNASVEGLADCIEWMAHGLEIVTCPYPDWMFNLADAIAAFGLHGALLIGEPKLLSAAFRHHLTQVLADSSVSLSCNENGISILRAAGFGSDVMGSPMYALKRLHRLLQLQPESPSLAAGEIISTGAWTEAYPLRRGQTWTTAFSGVSMSGLTISFV